MPDARKYPRLFRGVFIAFLFFINLCLGAWLDRQWFRQEPSLKPEIEGVSQIEARKPTVEIAEPSLHEANMTDLPQLVTKSEPPIAKKEPPVSSEEFYAEVSRILGQPDANHENLFKAVQAWANKYPETAIKWAMMLPKGTTRNVAVKAAWTAWTEKDPAAAADYAAALPAGRERLDLLAAATKQWSSINPDAAIEWAKQQPNPSTQNLALRQIAGNLAVENPAQAAELISTFAPGEEKWDLLHRVAAKWADGNLDNALVWMNQLSNNRDRQAAFQGLGTIWARKDPEAAMTYINGMDPQGQQSVMKSLFIPWAQQDASGALAAATRLTSEKSRLAAISMAAGKWAESAPTDAAQYVASLPAGNLQQNAALSVVTEWAEKDPKSAAQWVSNFPESDLQSKAISSVVRNWLEMDATTAAEWVAGLPETRSRNAALGAFALELSRSDPASALQWAQKITEPSQRQKSMEVVAAEWNRIDPSSARTWLEQTQWPDDAKNRVLQPKKK